MQAPQFHLLFDITGHGYGHLGQTVPVMTEIAQRSSDVRFTVRSHLSNDTILSFLPKDFPRDKITFAQPNMDIGLIMHDTINVDVQNSLKNYQTVHTNWLQHLESEKNALQAIKPNLLVSNVAYLSLEAAHQLNIPSIAFCSLDWASIFECYCGSYENTVSIIRDIKSSYARAEQFIQPRPHLRMDYLSNATSIAPIVQPMVADRHGFRKQLQLPKNARLVLVNMGGIALEMDSEVLPEINNTYWLVKDSDTRRSDVIDYSHIHCVYVDLLASCDLMIGKTSYGNIVQAAFAGVPMLNIIRPDWPEQRPIEQWCAENSHTLWISYEDFVTGNYQQPVQELLDKGHFETPPKQTGQVKAAELILQKLKTISLS